MVLPPRASMQIGEGIAPPASGSPAGGSSSPPPPGGALVRFEEIRGLYQPGHDDSAARGGSTIGCGYRLGYRSHDDRGRIFINHVPRASPSALWQAARRRDTQYIEAIVSVRGFGGTLPSGVEVEWTWSDPDDPTDTGMHAAAAAHVDPGGGGADDNRGQCDYPSPAAGSAATFEQLDAFTMTPVGTHGCRTPVTGGQSGVRLHCTNVGGDNLRLRATVSHPGLAGTAEVETGVMTMWKRIDVEYKELEGAYTFPVGFRADLQEHFDQCFVQLDVEPVQVVRGAPDHLVRRRAQLERAASRLARSPADGGIFDHAGQPGWFLLVAAKHASRDIATSQGSRVRNAAGGGTFTATAEPRWYGGSDPSQQRGELLRIPERISGRVAVVFIRNPSVTADRPDREIVIPVWQTQRLANATLLHLQGVTIVREFTGGDGSEDHAYSRADYYYPTHRYVGDTGAWESGGLGLTGTLEVALLRPGSWVTNGISPGRGGHFAGRTILFTHAAPATATLDADPSFLRTIVHEFGHAFGMPHRCSHATWEDPPDHSCTMNYSTNWLFEPGTTTLQPFNIGQRGRHFCARHVRAIREVHLEDNPEMWTW